MKECYICHRRFYDVKISKGSDYLLENDNGQVQCPVCNRWIYLSKCKDIEVEDVMV